jgi:hypothetical protein
MSMKNSSDIIWNRTRDFPVCSAVPQPLRQRVPHGTVWLWELVFALGHLDLNKEGIPAVRTSLGINRRTWQVSLATSRPWRRVPVPTLWSAPPWRRLQPLPGPSAGRDEGPPVVWEFWVKISWDLKIWRDCLMWLCGLCWVWAYRTGAGLVRLRELSTAGLGIVGGRVWCHLYTVRAVLNTSFSTPNFI